MYGTNKPDWLTSLLMFTQRPIGRCAWLQLRRSNVVRDKKYSIRFVGEHPPTT